MSLKILLIEDNKNLVEAVTSLLSKADYEVTTADSVGDALNEYRRHRFDVTILDGGVENGRGLDFVSALTPAPDATAKERSRFADGCKILVISRVGQTVPTDNILVKGTVPFPFATDQLTGALENMLSERDAAKARRVFEPPRKNADPAAVLSGMGIVPGKAYMFFQEKPNTVRSAVGAFAALGYDMYLVTAARPKVAKERMGLDRSADVFILSGSEYRLGSMVQAVRDFAEKAEKPVVAIDDLDSVINHCGLDRTLRALSELLRGRKGRDFTFMTSVNGRVLSDSIKGMLSELMIINDTEV